MTSPYNAVVWIDHPEAHILYLAVDGATHDVIRPILPPRRLYLKSGTENEIAAASEFYRAIIDALGDAKAVLIAGPSTAKTDFVKFLHQNSPQTLERVWGIETLARVTDHQLLTEGRRYFAKAERPTEAPD